MNAISKKLLSMLLVTAMVLSMVPFGSLSVFAAENDETQVASSTVTPGQANLPEGISTTNPVDNSDAAIAAHIAAGTCPMCNATGITWARQTGGGVTVNDQEGATKHVYFDTEFTTTSNFVQVVDTKGTDKTYESNGSSKNVTICIALKSTAAITCSKYRVQIAGTNATNVLNIMGTGSLHSDQTLTSGASDVGLFQVDKGTLNLYGGTYTHTTNQDATNDTNAVIRINNSSATVNMYDGVVVGPETVDTTKWGHNVRVDGGTFNMYGGTIRNGVSKTNGISGNVTIANSGKMYMYGGTISGGNLMVAGVVGGNVVVGGKKQAATSSSAGNFYMYGGTITGGKAQNGGNGGGNITNYNGGGNMHLLGGIIENGNATWGGGNVAVQAGTATKNVIGGTVLIRNGTITGDNGANVVVQSGKGLTMSGGFIQGDSATQKKGNGGGICLLASATLNMTGGEISNMNVAGSGGAIYAAPGSSEDAPTTVTIGGTAVLDNNQAASYGGNVHLNGANCILNVTGGTIKNGHTTGTSGSGGNLSGATGSTMNISGGSIFGGYNPSGNDGASWGGNIRCYQGTLNISGGYIYNGYAKDSTDLGNYAAGNIGVMGDTSRATAHISGGHIGGDIHFSKADVKLSGTPEIKYSAMDLPDGTKSNRAHYNGLPATSSSNYDISELQPGANIQVTGAIGTTFTAAHENAANVVSCFTSTAGSTRKVELQADNTLKIVENVVVEEEPTKDKFEPEKFEGEAYCPVCKDFVIWTAYNGENNSSANKREEDPINYDAHFHLYLKEDKTYSVGNFYHTYRKTCFNLNGCDITALSGSDSTFVVTNTLNIIDTEGGAVVTGYANSGSRGATLQLNGSKACAVYNIYGGTYTKLAADTKSSIAYIGANGGTINMYEGATIDATGRSTDAVTASPAVTLRGSIYNADSNKNGGLATFNMEGGEIKGGNAITGGAVSVGIWQSGTPYGTATFNMKGGKVSGGTVDHLLKADGTVEKAAAGGNFRVQYGGTLTISGGTICGGTVIPNDNGSSWGGNISSWNGNVNISGDALIYGGEGGQNLTGANVSAFSDPDGRGMGYGKLTISGGTIVGDVASYVNTGSGYLTLSGAPTIVTSMEIDGKTVEAVNGGLYFSGYTANIDGLLPAAQIEVTASLNKVITDASSNASAVAGCFTSTNSEHKVALQTDNTLKIVEAVVEAPTLDKFEPEKFEGMAYCPVCYANGTHTEPVEWTAVDTTYVAKTLEADSHYYLKVNITAGSKGDKNGYMTAPSGKISCLNLNGKDLTVTDGSVFFGGNGTLNIMDTAEEQGTVTGGRTSSGGAAIQLNGGKASSTINIYGGIFKKSASNNDASVVCIAGNGGTVNMYGGTIDASGMTTTTNPSAVYLQGSRLGQYSGLATFNMYGGTIKGGTSTGNGGAIRVGNSASETSTMSYVKAAIFNMYGGLIDGGTSDGNGGIFYVYGNTVNISGGTIQGGVAAKDGGIFYLERKTPKDDTASGAVVNISQTDATKPTIISGGTANGSGGGNGGGTFCLATGCELNISGGTVYGGTTGNKGGICRAYKSDINLSGDATLYAGTGTKGFNGVWVLCSEMTMSGNSTVYGSGTASGNAVAVAPYGDNASNAVGASLIMSGNATVKNATGESRNNLEIGWTLTSNTDSTDDMHGVLMITNDWNGEAYINITKNNGVAEDGKSSALVGYKNGEIIDNAAVACGSMNDGAFTKGGTFTGKMYYSPASNAGLLADNGDLLIALASVGDDWFASYDDALDAYYANGSFANGEIFTVNSNATLTLNGDIYIEGKGYNVTVDGTGKLYALDRANDDYDGYGVWNVTGSVKVVEDVTNPVNGNRYIVIKNKAGENKYSAHRIEVKLTNVTLRASEAGLYYKASYKCDGALAGRVSAYGVAVSTKATPGADFLEDYTNKIGFTCLENFDKVHETTGENAYTVNATSGSVFGIFKNETLRPGTADKTTAQLNAEYGKMKIYANTYFLVDTLADEDADNDYVVVSDTKNGGTTNGIGYSLHDAMVAIDGMWNKLEEKKQNMVKDFYKQWKDLGMSEWANDFANIDA